MAARLKIELFGGLRVNHDYRTISRFRTQKTAALLAYLAYQLGRSHQRESLIEMLWPWADPQAGRQSLTTALSSLRHQLEPPGIPAGAVVIADRDKVGLHTETVITDVAAFEAELSQAEKASSKAAKAW